jgi:hypothetical protein
MSVRNYDLQKLIDQKKLALDYVHIDPSQIAKPVTTIWRVFSRLGFAIDSVGAARRP